MIMHNSRNPVLSFSTLFYLFYQGSLKNVIFSNVNKIKFYHSRTNTCICKCLINTYFLQTTEAESDTYIVVSKSLIYLEFHSRVDDLLGHLYWREINVYSAPNPLFIKGNAINGKWDVFKKLKTRYRTFSI